MAMHRRVGLVWLLAAALLSGLNVFEQVLVPAGPASRLPGERTAAPDTADQLLEFTGLHAVAAVEADQLPFGAQRRVELARALARYPAVLLLDEPASGLSASERADLADILRRLAGPAVLLVEHDVPFALSVADRVIVLEAGHVLFDGPTGDVAEAGVLDVYLGRPPRRANQA
jgi:ABC-type branched-subunit amino acid transport system ATPase component